MSVERVEAEAEGARLVELGVPGDAAPGLFGGELARPVVAVGVVELVERERLAVLEQLAVVGGEGVVDAAAEEHGGARRRAFALEVVPAPVLRAEQEAAVGGV